MTDTTREWENKGMCDDLYYIKVHVPCGIEIMVMGGYVAVCPKCQPEEWKERVTERGAK